MAARGISEDVIHVLKRFARDRSGATVIEYALLLATLSMGVLMVYETLSGQMSDFMGSVGDDLTAAPTD